MITSILKEESVVTSLLEFTIGCGLFTFLMKKVIESYLRLGVEAFKERMKHESSLNLAGVKHELELKYMRATGLRETQSRNVLELYKCVIELQSALAEAEGPKSLDGLLAAAEVVVKFMKFYNGSRLFFPKHVCKKIDDLLVNHLKALSEISDLGLGRPGKGTLDEIEKELRSIRSELEDEFRRLLGSEA